MLTHRTITEAVEHCDERATAYPSGSDERTAYNVATLRLLTMPLGRTAIDRERVEIDPDGNVWLPIGWDGNGEAVCWELVVEPQLPIRPVVA
jgi:hypothetical protein